VVVLGRTGRNFAAGMSGGLAFILDEDGTFRSRCNPALLDDLTTPDEADAIELRDLIAEHVARTASPVGQRVLDDFEALLPKFVKVFPADYRRVLEQLAREEDESMRAPRADEFAGDGAVDVVGEPAMRSGEGE
jgi:glutamate synthase (NADPH/NADH) large chain/glutamate synthase (ferredoxin)